MLQIEDPLDPENKYGLIVYEYQRTANEIELIYQRFFYSSEPAEILNVIPELLAKHKQQQDDFFEGKCMFELERQYHKTCENPGLIIDIALNRMN